MSLSLLDHQLSMVFDPELRKSFDVFTVVLLSAAADTLLPELYEVLGSREKLIDLLDVFAGRTVCFPEEDVLRDSVRDTMIYVAIQRGETPQSLALKYGLTLKTITETSERVRETLAATGC